MSKIFSRQNCWNNKSYIHLHLNLSGPASHTDLAPVSTRSLFLQRLTSLFIPDLSVVALQYGRPCTSVITPDPLWACGGTGRQTACLAPVFTLMSTFDSSRDTSGSQLSPLLHLHRRDVSWVRRPRGKPKSVLASLIRLSPGCNVEAAGDIGVAAPSTLQRKPSFNVLPKTMFCFVLFGIFYFTVWETITTVGSIWCCHRRKRCSNSARK